MSSEPQQVCTSSVEPGHKENPGVQNVNMRHWISCS